MELLFHYGDPFHRVTARGPEPQCRALLAGQITAPLDLLPSKQVGVLGVRFHPGGAASFFPFPQQEVAGRLAPLEDLLGPEARRLTCRIGEAGSARARVAILEQFLLSRFRPPEPWLEMLQPVRPHPRLWLETAGVGPRQFRRRFQNLVGLPPKLFARIRRFHVSLQLVETMPLAAAACESGYADQAHFTRDFREFSGLTPTAYLRQRHLLNDRFLQDAPPAALPY